MADGVTFAGGQLTALAGGGGGGGPVTIASGGPGIIVTGGPGYTVTFGFAGETWGDTLFRGAAAWQRLPAGANGRVLTTHGVGADPTWEPATAAVTVAGGNNIGVTGGPAYTVSLRRDQPIRLNNTVEFQGTATDTVTAVALATVGADDRIKLGDGSATFDIDLLAAAQVVLPNAVYLGGYDTGGVARALAQVNAGDETEFGDATTDARAMFLDDFRFQNGGGVVGASLHRNNGNLTTLNVGSANTGAPLEGGSLDGAVAAGSYWAYNTALLTQTKIASLVYPGAGVGLEIGDPADLRVVILAGGFAPRRVGTAVSAAFSPNAATIIGVASTAAPRTITVGAATVAGTIITIVDESGGAGTNPITIVGSTVAITFDGATSATINTNNGSRTYEWDGAVYHSIASANLAAAAVTVAGTAPITVTGGPAYTIALDYDTTRFALSGSTIRPQLANAVSLQARNSANTLNIDILSLDASNTLQVGSTGTAAFSLVGGGGSRSSIVVNGFVHSFDINAGIVIGANASTVAAPPAGIGVANQSVGGSFATAGYFGRNAANGAWLQGLGWGAGDVMTLGNASGRTLLGGGFTDRRTATATNYTVLQSDRYVGVTSTAAVRIITLPSAVTSGAGAQYVVADESGGAATNNISIISAAGTINGIAAATGVLIGTNYDAWIFVSDGTNWTGRPWFDPSVAAIAKPTARVVATANVAALTGANTTDGVVLATGDIIQLTAQSTGSQNGPWVVNTAGAWARPFWFSTSGMVTLAHYIGVREGTNGARTTWYLTNTTAPTLGSTTLTYSGDSAVYGVVATPDTSDLLVWRRGAALTKYGLARADSAGNVSFGDTTVAATLLVGNNDVRLTTTNGSGVSASNYGFTNIEHVWNMASGVSSIDQIHMTANVLRIGARHNTTAAVPALVVITGSEPASTQTDTPPSGEQIDAGRGRGTGQGMVALSAWDPVGTGTTLQTVQRTSFTARSRYITYGAGQQRNVASVAGGNITVVITHDVIEYTSIPTTGLVTLPAANAVPAGWEVTIGDRSALASVVAPITISRVGADTINAPEGPAGTSIKIQTAAGTRILRSDGASQWFATGEF